MDSIAYCYLLENNITKDQYIGITDNFERRKQQHYYGSNKYLKKDIEIYGWKNFSMKKLFKSSRKYCFELEPKLIQIYRCNKYNIDMGGPGKAALPGEAHHLAKLKEYQVINIRKKYAEGNITLKTLALEYGVCFQEISNIVRGKNWINTPGPIQTTNKSIKLTKEKVLELRKFRKENSISNVKLAKLYNIKRSQVSNIILGHSWKHIGGPIKGVDY